MLCFLAVCIVQSWLTKSCRYTDLCASCQAQQCLLALLICLLLQAVSTGTDAPKSPVASKSPDVPKSPGVSKSPLVSKSHDAPESPDAPNSPTIASASAADQQPFGPLRATFDPRLTLQHHHAQRVQSEVRTHLSSHVHRAGHRSPRNKAAPRHESRVIPSPDRQKSPPAHKVIL